MGDFTSPEAREYLGKVNIQRGKDGKPELSQDDIDLVLRQVGTRPADLHDVTTSSSPVREFVEDRIRGEHAKIKALLQEDSNYEGMLHSLVDRKELDNCELMDMLHQPIEQIAEVAGAKRHVISYNPVTRKVQFHSQATAVAAADRTAAEEARKAALRFSWWRK